MNLTGEIMGRGKFNTKSIIKYYVGGQTKDVEVLNIPFVLHIWPVMVVVIYFLSNKAV
jgi:hypothetical protein